MCPGLLVSHHLVQPTGEHLLAYRFNIAQLRTFWQGREKVCQQYLNGHFVEILGLFKRKNLPEINHESVQYFQARRESLFLSAQEFVGR